MDNFIKISQYDNGVDINFHETNITLFRNIPSSPTSDDFK